MLEQGMYVECRECTQSMRGEGVYMDYGDLTQRTEMCKVLHGVQVYDEL